MKSIVKKWKQSLRSGSSKKSNERHIEEERWFVENGGIFLKKLIADCNGKSIPIRSFSSFQILKATNNFDSSCRVIEEADHEWYKGIIEDKFYLIKRFFECRVTERRVREIYNDIVLSARMSNHRNFLKLFGYCFEFSLPVIVFENAEHGALNHRGGVMVNGVESLLPLSLRLKIGKEIANALTYLHTAFPKITIHRDVKPTNVFLNKNWTAKLCNFLISITLPEGKSRIETDLVIGTLEYLDPLVLGTLGYLDPSYYVTSSVSEYSDVCSFGIFLMVMLAGKPALSSTGSDEIRKHIVGYVKGLYENGKLDELIDPMMMEDITSAQRLQVEACLVLALRCCQERDEDRPKMIQVAKELKRIQRSFLRDPLLLDYKAKFENHFGLKYGTQD